VEPLRAAGWGLAAPRDTLLFCVASIGRGTARRRGQRDTDPSLRLSLPTLATGSVPGGRSEARTPFLFRGSRESSYGRAMRADRAMGDGGGSNQHNQRIDLGAPLRSARLADAPTPPQYKAGLDSGPLRHPGAVPFAWEQRPGQPKSVRTRRAAPPTPPRETSSWTTRPGEEIGGSSPYHDALGELDLQALRGGADRGSRTVVAASRKVVVVVEDEAAVAAEPTKEVVKKDEALQVAAVLRKQHGEVEDEEDEERFSDALDTLSRTESFAMNCSVSGLSGVPDPGQGAEPGSRGFMMDRFLPAAQAVAVGSPQYTFRKAGAAVGTGNDGREHARAAAVKAGAGNGEDRMRRAPVQLPYQHLPPNYLSCAYPRHEQHEEEDEEDDDGYDVHSTRGFSAKGCGLLPSLCVKTSLLLLNPMPAMKRGKKVRGWQLPCKGRGQMAQSPLARSSQNKHLGCDSNGVLMPARIACLLYSVLYLCFLCSFLGTVVLTIWIFV